MRDKKFYIEAVKMDLLRLVTQVADLETPVSKTSVKTFFDHAISDLAAIKLSDTETKLKQELIQIENDLDAHLQDPIKRLRWAEKILTIRCQL